MSRLLLTQSSVPCDCFPGCRALIADLEYASAPPGRWDPDMEKAFQRLGATDFFSGSDPTITVRPENERKRLLRRQPSS